MTTTTEHLEKGKSNGDGNFESLVRGIQAEQSAFYRSGATKTYEFRKQQLKKLKKLIKSNYKLINEAVKKDLRRNDFSNAFLINGVLNEIDYALETVFTIKPPFVSKRLKQWMKPRKKKSPLLFLGSKLRIQHVPKGVVLVIGPWNYPFSLMMTPVVGAIAAGNTVFIKPSEYATHTAQIIEDLINSNFDKNFLYVQQGSSSESRTLTEMDGWDHIFFTGGTEIGRSVYQAAAKNLIPVTLELGGKSPTIVNKDADLNLAAKRIVQMKFINSGQTCIAPDYLFVHKDIQDELVGKMKHYLDKFYGNDPQKSVSYSRMINTRHFDRMVPLIEDQDVVTGGNHDRNDKYFPPTILDNVSPDSPVMQDEIFGPILPVMTFQTTKEVIDYIEDRPHPLSLYVYSSNKNFQKEIFENTTFGGGMVNDSVLHYLHENAPFGGIGDSGIGNYHGKYSFLTFTQERAIIYAGGLIDRTLEKIGIKFFRYPPETGLKLRLLNLFHRTFRRFRF